MAALIVILVIIAIVSVSVNVWLAIENRELKGQIRWMQQNGRNPLK